ncbi:gamma-glutamyltransferase [Salisediminibacterium beveridgei]|uniref:Gamma-glutamyltranspeptidase PgsD/CapD n=1 Tax=Salisediminibacterium beveridgei TaxID=632773 RepID=A0A1D7QRJ4_9BACI|nr:gamma-glutamyltransferase [Salisediminibacterium beveridgei]AOM81624.1 Gamma-glutamyltranspeptidase PgsD/CapD [Salisediminibacterium beveridgei]
MGNTSKIIRYLTNVIGIPLVIIWIVLAYFEIQPQQEGAGEVQETSFEESGATGVYAVSAAHPKAVSVGKEILADGGNAYDAAIAISFALGVVEPYGSGIGGGGAMIAYDPTEPEGEEINYIDYREVAPKSLITPSMVADTLGFVTESGEVPTPEEWEDIKVQVTEGFNQQAEDEGMNNTQTGTASEEAHPYQHVIDYLLEQPELVVGNETLMEAVAIAGEVEEFIGTPTPSWDEETGEWVTDEPEGEWGTETRESVEEEAVVEEDTDQFSDLSEAEQELITALDTLEVTPAQWGNHYYMEDFGIPGFLKGMAHLYENYATYDMETLLRPSVNLARPGEDFDTPEDIDTNTVLADQYLQDRFNFAQERLSPSEIPHFYPNNTRITLGEELIQDELAQTLEDIIEMGDFDRFFMEELAPAMVEAYPLLTMEDFQDYNIITDQEVSTGTFDKYDIYSAPEPLAGPVLIQALQLADYMETGQHAVREFKFASPIKQAESGTAVELEEDPRAGDVGEDSEGNGEETRTTEEIISDIESYLDYMEKVIGINFVTYQDRLTNIGDPNTSERARERGGEHLTSGEKLIELYEAWNTELEEREERREFDDPDGPDEQESGTEVFHENPDNEGLFASADSFFDARSEIDQHVNTSHFVIIDREGRMITSTHTLSNFFGSGEFFKGFFLNDQLSNFSETVGSINEPYPERRPRSFMTPTLFIEHDEDGNVAEMIGIGSPGGARIPMMITQVMLHHRQYGMDFEESIRQMPRFQYSYNSSNERYEMRLEPVFQAHGDNVYNRMVTELEARGHNPGIERLGMYFGAVQALRMNPLEGDFSGFADPRRGGTTDSGSADPEEEGDAE